MIFEIADVIISGLINGSVYALMAVGLTLIYGVSRAFNFAYGSFYSLGGYIAFLLFGLSFINNYFLVFLLAAPILLLFGFFVEKALVAPLRKRDDWEIKVMMITLGLALLLDNAYQVIFGARMKSLPPFLGGAFEAGDFYLSHQDVGIFFLSIGGILLFRWFLNNTRTGMSVRAVAQNRIKGKIPCQALFPAIGTGQCGTKRSGNGSGGRRKLGDRVGLVGFLLVVGPPVSEEPGILGGQGVIGYPVHRSFPSLPPNARNRIRRTPSKSSCFASSS